ncbi:hypothetical protein NE683_06260 [Bariatricus massiliensis]|uniref:Uncharacterized protein n=1 Tax=Bariatricus massiliensis TaxID=1745713 RepID=A0ABS8DF65_9FIRM|nr:hypothetical protein [Bariatricus massiliensis]MCB7303951.1 hypothetical protein [Bariatricus massiliensis]MCB7374618.1 hypothetical protein [Bariatricus massiliensis]MCB7387061.1 hypothetical protein [Bariatricus massiliensis]MCB7411223.1 hypothetical protein [Bariatricus massiliensis]MCQ5252833.1 hypothetical protein [Bariatricus massiliensis]
MQLTSGMIMIAVSIVGNIGCIIALAATKRIFTRQRRKLLMEIEME